MTKNKSQQEGFKEASRELECDEDEERFNAVLKRIVTAKPEKHEKPTKE